ncbi:MAG TPA: hypothetical protein PLF78_02090 [Caulobacter sp.]|nr:hypothetical protein [Caulobacter sp.]
MNLADWFEKRLNKTVEIGRENARSHPILTVIEAVVVAFGYLGVLTGMILRLIWFKSLSDSYALFRPTQELLQVTDGLAWIGLALLVAQSLYNWFRNRSR